MSNDKNTSNNKNVLGKNTIIQFTLGGFILTIMSILGIFFGFYQYFFEPKMEQTNDYHKMLYTEQRQYINNEFNEIKNAIQINTRAIEATNERFRKLNKTFREINSSGSFGFKFPIYNDSTTIKNDSIIYDYDYNKSLVNKN